MVPYSNGELAQMEQAGKNMKQPITMTIVDKIAEEIQKDTEAKVYKAVFDIGITINKAELIRALELDKKVRSGEFVEVVRCNDCRFWDGWEGCKSDHGLRSTSNECFCYFGKRKEADQ